MAFLRFSREAARDVSLVVYLRLGLGTGSVLGIRGSGLAEEDELVVEHWGFAAGAGFGTSASNGIVTRLTSI